MSTTNFSNDPGAAAPGSDTSSDKKQQAQQAAGTAADEGKRVAGVAQDEVRNVASEATDQVRGLLDEATTQLDEQSKAQKTRLADTVRTFGDDLHSMTTQDESDGVAAQVVRQVADQARTIASHLEDREPRELLDDVRSFARRRPGTFLLGALAAGVVVGRVTRGAKSAQDSSTGSGSAAGTGTPVASRPPVTTSPAAPAHETPRPVVGAAHVETETDLGPKGVEISEAGLPPARGGLA
jgi:hypothetical protein